MEPATFQIGDVIDQKYEVQAVLPAGGSGRVYKVYDAVWDQTWALKVFNDTAMSLDWLKQEARTLKAFDHPNIVKVNTWGRLQSGRLYLVSEFVEGEDLTAYAAGAKRMPVRRPWNAQFSFLQLWRQSTPTWIESKPARQKWTWARR